MNEKKYPNSEIAVALDIGTTKVCAIAGRLNEYGKIEVLGLGTVKSEGVSRGVVSNIRTTTSNKDFIKKARIGLKYVVRLIMLRNKRIGLNITEPFRLRSCG